METAANRINKRIKTKIIKVKGIAKDTLNSLLEMQGAPTKATRRAKKK